MGIKGQIPWNKGKRTGQIPANKGKKHTADALRKQTEAKMGERNPNWGKHFSANHRRKLGETHKGELNGNWKGGVSSENQIFRHCISYRLWREAVFARDNFTCQECSNRGGVLNAHHIKPFAKHPEFRTSIENGITYCEKCHKNIRKGLTI